MKIKRTLLYIITGLSLALAFPPINIYTLYFIGIALLIYTVHNSGNFKQVFLRSYFTFLSFEMVTVSWISLSGLREGADKFLIAGGFITIVIHSALLTLPLVLYYYTQKRLAAYLKSAVVFTLPFIWVTIEYLYALPEVSFPWVTAGNAFTTALHKIQFIEITGVYGISFWVLNIGCLLYLIIEKASVSKESLPVFLKRKEVIYISLIIIVLFFLPDIYSITAKSYNKHNGNYSEGKLRISIVQPNVNPWKKWGSKQNELVNDYVELLRVTDSASVKSDLIIFPETATPFYLLNDYYTDKYDLIKNTIDSIKTPLLIGTPDLVYYNDSIIAKPDSKINKTSGQKYDSFNSAVLINPYEERVSHQKYAKNKLVIASERMPYQEKIPFFRDIIRWSVGISSFQVGRDTTIFKLGDKAEFNTAICYETIYPEYFASFVEKGSQFSVIITNDGWWGKLFGTHQHKQFAVLRAIENRRWIARCGNTGISCFLDSYGNIYDETEINQKAIISGDIGLSRDITFYTRNPYLFPDILLIITVLIFIAAITERILKRKVQQ
ncbi:MAG: apolipoprotein N-acyltransferase [Ignavibacteria bacterium]